MRQTPYWWAESDGTAAHGAVTKRPLPARSDVAVIGAGYTGLAAARRLARAGSSVVVLEKETLGWGASSRNGGQVLTGLKLGADALLRRFGRERAQALHAASLAAIDFLESLILEEGIECGFARTGHLEAAFKASHFVRFEREQELLEREFAHRVRLIRRAEQRSELGSDLYHGLMLDERSGGLHPARYARGLAAAAARAGAGFHEETPVLDIRREGARFAIETPRGTLAADAVLVATNGYTDAAVPALRRRVVPVGSHVIATERLEPRRAAALLPRRRMVFDSKNFLYYFRLSPDDRLLFGGRAQFTPSSPRSTRASIEILRRGMLDVFPELAANRVEYAWSGNVCFTRDLLPRAGCLDGLYYAMGYGGHGVAMATYLGDVVADSILGKPDRNPFRDLPFPAIPLYDGQPWFLPLVGMWYKVADWLR